MKTVRHIAKSAEGSKIQNTSRRITISLPHEVYAILKTEEARRSIAGRTTSMSSIIAEAVLSHLGKKGIATG